MKRALLPKAIGAGDRTQDATIPTHLHGRPCRALSPRPGPLDAAATVCGSRLQGSGAGRRARQVRCGDERGLQRGRLSQLPSVDQAPGGRER